MVIINNTKFYEIPTSCGTCPFLMTGNTDVPRVGYRTDRGLCLQWDEVHHTWTKLPRRCAKVFKKAFEQYNDSGENLVITQKDRQ